MKFAFRLVYGCVAFVSATVTAQAQTYYYYPSSGPSAPGVTAGTTTAPTYYYRRGLFGRSVRLDRYILRRTTRRRIRLRPLSLPTKLQPGNQARPAQTLSDAQVIPTSYSADALRRPAAGRRRPATPASTDAGDPYGFTGWLNATRAAYGLPAVGHDPNLSSWAAENNNQQAARGMGHFVMGPARRQNAAFGSVSNIGSMWMNSPAHRAALLDPTIRWIGIAGLGAYWTFNAY